MELSSAVSSRSIESIGEAFAVSLLIQSSFSLTGCWGTGEIEMASSTVVGAQENGNSRHQQVSA